MELKSLILLLKLCCHGLWHSGPQPFSDYSRRSWHEDNHRRLGGWKRAEFSLRFVRPLCLPDHQDLICLETDRRALAELKPFRLLGFRQCAGRFLGVRDAEMEGRSHHASSCFLLRSGSRQKSSAAWGSSGIRFGIVSSDQAEIATTGQAPMITQLLGHEPRHAGRQRPAY